MDLFKTYFVNIILLIVFSALTIITAVPYYVVLSAFVLLWMGKLHIIFGVKDRLAKNASFIAQEYVGHMYSAALLPNAKKPMLPDLKELNETITDTVYCIVLILFVLAV